MQKKDLIAYADIVLGIKEYEIFEDAGYSGKNTDRPAFQHMMARIRANEFSHLLVWKIDRISRNLLDFSQMYKELQKLRVTFVSKNEQFDTSTAIGEAMLKIILVFAELERNMTSERVTATMLSRASSGIWNGGKIPFGYNYDPKTMSFSINESEAVVCRRIRDEYLSTHSLTLTVHNINAEGMRARSGKEWSMPTAHRILESPFYAGIYRYNVYREDGSTYERKPKDEWIYVYDHHPAIFTIDEYNLIRSIRESNAKLIRKNGQPHHSQQVHVFSGLAICGVCGARMSASPGRKHVDGFRTTNHFCPVSRNTVRCDNPTVIDLTLGEFVLNYILNIIKAKTSFSSLRTLDDLERRLLSGSVFSGIRITEGLSDLYDLLSSYGSDDSFTLTIGNRKPKKPTQSLRREKEKQERALSRLNDIYLYADGQISEKEYILKRTEIVSRLDSINAQLDTKDDPISNETFIRLASHLLISSQLKDKEHIYYKRLAQDVAPDILHQYVSSVIDSVTVAYGKVTAITFKNGMTHTFTQTE